MDMDKTTNKGAVTCEFDLRTGEYAWLNERYQSAETPEVISKSILLDRKTEAYCVEVISLEKEMNNGRTCDSSW